MSQRARTSLSQLPVNSQQQSGSQKRKSMGGGDDKEEESRKLKMRLRAVAETIKDHQEDISDVTKRKFTDMMNEIEETSEYCTTIDTGMMDVKNVHMMADLGVKQGRAVEKTSLRTHTPQELVSKLAATFAMSGPDAEEDATDWAAIGALGFRWMKAVPSVMFCNGPFGVAAKEKRVQQRAQRLEKRVYGEEKEAEVVDAKKEETTMTDSRVNALQKTLGKMTGKTNYFEFVINPHSYTETIENMYDLSSVIKFGNARCFVEEDGFPYIQGKKTPNDSELQAGLISGQCIVDINRKQYKELISLFKIK